MKGAFKCAPQVRFAQHLQTNLSANFLLSSLSGDSRRVLAMRHSPDRANHCNLWLSTQVLEGRSHALLQETGVNLVDIIREEGFYVRERRMSAPAKGRKEGKFGSALPIELPTEPEMDKAAQQCVQLAVITKP